ncbi:UDP-N-acetylglucosamine 2-epimerase [Desulfonema limicola]|uniref:UDP-N-acetylglucosamine 2-epimerase n=1 Tax=Desulfonema limicola TaxID=45656 RepID=A0A975GJD2_9BACT|nr:UDP-N-acetylglucosamine 2-epimerase (non-hydrolyzing) [Desulfonema limicola]QTA83277.1 UDP-N-acetylglucosamine 2-epimerase [Desulfonema limicola]
MKKSKKQIHLIVAARPNFMKIAPLYHALKKEEWADPVIIHTGQHYDLNMSDVFFQDMGIPEPDIHLGVGSGTHAEQTGQVMIAYEKILINTKPDLVIVPGDVNSTMAAAIAAVKLGIKVAHLEAGLRSFDRTMPEEINRMVTDTLADILWTPSPDGDENLIREGVPKHKICRVGNIMIDSLEMLRNTIEKQNTFEEYGIKPKKYGLVTLHRPSNVDAPETLSAICELLAKISSKIPLLFPLHPRTRKNLEKYKLLSQLESVKEIQLLDPLNYIRFMNLVFNCRFVITDSGGIQEETSYLNIPCLTMRSNTERPVTIKQGTNRLCRLENLEKYTETILSGEYKTGQKIDLWDGKTSDRVVESIRGIV